VFLNIKSSSLEVHLVMYTSENTVAATSCEWQTHCNTQRYIWEIFIRKLKVIWLFPLHHCQLWQCQLCIHFPALQDPKNKPNRLMRSVSLNIQLLFNTHHRKTRVLIFFPNVAIVSQTI